MICFRDRAFCSHSAECRNEKCSRNLTDTLREQAAVWWREDEVSVAYQDFRTPDCGYVAKVAAKEGA